MAPPATDREEQAFGGFPDGLGLLEVIGGSTKDEFAALQPAWNQTLLDPTRRLVALLGDRLRAEVSSSIESSPKVNGSISPITRDLRFAPSGSPPYKDHLLINLWDGPTKKTAPTLRVRIATDAVGFAAGAMFDPGSLARWRAAVGGEAGDQMLASLDAAAAGLEGTALELSDPELKKVPPGHDPDRAASALLRHRSFQARFLRPTPDDVSRPAFGAWIGDELVRLAPIHLWLKEHVS